MTLIDDYYTKIKQAIFEPLNLFFHSNNGNICLRVTGPVMVCLYYTVQTLHALFFFYFLVPIINEQFESIYYIVKVSNKKC